jgi:hypothetical protein
MNILKFPKFAVISVSMLFVAACSTTGTSVSEVGNRGQEDFERAGAVLANARGQQGLRGGGAQVNVGVFVASVKERNNSSALLPTPANIAWGNPAYT